jgi:DNA (cytosine-5)-methyltransferase 1
MSRRPVAVDLFAGAGGMSLGFEQAGFDVLAAVEIDPVHCATYHYNFPQGTIICKDIAEVSATEIRNQSLIQQKEIDVVFGGSPCQGFSIIGKRALDDPRNSLVVHFIRLVSELQPKYFVFENVKGLTIGRQRQFLEELIICFQKYGYRVKENYRVLNAVNYGVPQHRERLFLLGSREGLALPDYPEPISQSPGASLPYLPHAPTVWQAIADLPDIEQYPALLETDFCQAVYGTPISEYTEILRGWKRPRGDYSYGREWHPTLLTCSRRTLHSPECVARFRSTPVGTIEPVSRFLRLDPYGVCNTLRAGTARNRGSFTSPRPIHPHYPRCITVREAARLHSYPDWFRFHSTNWHGFRQVGNSVPPLLAQAVAREILKALGQSPAMPQAVLPRPDSQLLQWSMSRLADYFGVSRHIIQPRSRRKEVI